MEFDSKDLKKIVGKFIYTVMMFILNLKNKKTSNTLEDNWLTNDTLI